MFWVISTIVVAVVAGLAAAKWMYQYSLQAAARTTVVWISIDGMRGDYVQRGDFPFFVRLRREAATTDKLRPVFPSITFPSHCSEATGVTVEKHGITANAFYDAATKTQYSYPNDSSLLQAEPIWLTAQRQGVRTAVLDWPLSFAQKGAIRTEIFDEKFDSAMPDEQRLNRLLDAWSASLAKADPVPLHLLMGYIIATDKPGHNNGPDSPEILQAMIMLDAQLTKFSERAVELWKRQRKTPEDRLFFVFSTDHGMSTVKTLVSLPRLLNVARRDPEIRLSTTGNVGHVFLDGVKYPRGSEAREAKLREFRATMIAAGPDFQAFKREDMPAAWGYAHPTRCGDLIIILPRGYTFGWAENAAAISEVGTSATGPIGMHGYDPATNPEMMGFFAIWEFGKIKPMDLGAVGWDQLHPTVAKLLGINPSPTATGTPLAIAASAK